MDSNVSTTGFLSVQIKEHVWQGGKNLHLISCNLILTSSHPNTPNWRKTMVKEVLCVIFYSLLLLLCVSFTPPPTCVLCWPSELCVHFNP